MKRISRTNSALIIPFFILVAVSCQGFLSGNKSGTKTIDFDTAYKSAVGNTVLATVGNKKITVREFLCGYEFGPAFVKRDKDSKRRYLKYMIDEKLLALDGYKKRIR